MRKELKEALRIILGSEEECCGISNSGYKKALLTIRQALTSNVSEETILKLLNKSWELINDGPLNNDNLQKIRYGIQQSILILKGKYQSPQSLELLKQEIIDGFEDMFKTCKPKVHCIYMPNSRAFSVYTESGWEERVSLNNVNRLSTNMSIALPLLDKITTYFMRLENENE